MADVLPRSECAIQRHGRFVGNIGLNEDDPSAQVTDPIRRSAHIPLDGVSMYMLDY
jgi:hypothetical protein